MYPSMMEQILSRKNGRAKSRNWIENDWTSWDPEKLVDRPTQLIHIGISICQHTSTKDIAGQSAIPTGNPAVNPLSPHTNLVSGRWQI